MTSMLLGIPPGHGAVYGLILYGVGILILAIFVRVIVSWVGLDERNAFIRFLARLTDPFLEPVRRIVRRAGVIDISFLVSSFLLGTLQVLLLQSLPPGW